jgi:hypothetical protein
MMSFAYYAVAAAVSPVKALKRLAAEPRPVRAAARAVGFVGLLYILASAVMALAGAVPLATVFILVPPENYYFWQIFFILPWVLLVWILVSGLIHILGKRERARPAFERTAASAGVALAASLFVAWVPEALAALFLALGMGQRELVDILSAPGGWQVIYVSLYILAVAVAMVLLTLAAGQGHQKKKGARLRAALIGGLAAAVVAGAFVLFVR